MSEPGEISYMRNVMVTVAGILALGLAQASVAQMARQNLEIKRQPLRLALKDLGEKTGLQIMFRAEDVAKEAREAPQVSGNLSVEEALDTLLKGRGLTYRFVTPTMVLVSKSGPATTSLALATEEPVRLAQLDTAAVSASQQAAPAATDGSSGLKLDEIVVTAQKRAENILDVPVSITAITAAEIERRGLVNAEDYLRGVPGANHVDSPFGQSIVIRGIETTPSGQNFNSGTTVATYFGETPTTTSAGLSGGTNVDIKLVDIDRVEVLRGPQGTAFGNSSLGGAVRTIPQAPKLNKLEGRVAAGYEVTSGTGGGNDNVQGMINIPLAADRLAVRGVAYRFNDSGFYRNVAASNAAYRAAVVIPQGAEAFAIDEKEMGGYLSVGGRVSALFQANEDLRITLSYLTQKTELDGFAMATSGRYEQTLLRVAPEHVIRGQTAGVFDTDIDIANATAEYSLGWADLLATYSHTRSGSTARSPATNFGLDWALSNTADSDHEENVGEIRLATKLEGRWNALVGLYAEKLEDGAFSDYIWHGDPAANFIVPGLRSMGSVINARELKQKAAFGELSWELSTGLTFTGGVRAYDYERASRSGGTGVFGEGGDGSLSPALNADSSGESFRANLSYKRDDALYYAGWSQGFRLGRPQTGLPAGVCDRDADGIVDGTTTAIESTKSVNSDEVDSYEVGTKMTFLDRRMTVTADIFRMDWSGLPVSLMPGDASAGCTSAYLANAGEARSRGIELQTSVQVTRALQVDLGGSWIDAELTEDEPALGAAKGNRLPGAPRVNANLSFGYSFDLLGHAASVRADSVYIGKFHGDLSQSKSLETGNYVKLDVSARLQIGKLDVAAFVQNLTNEDAFTFRGNYPVVGEFFGYRLRPRTVGLQLSCLL